MSHDGSAPSGLAAQRSRPWYGRVRRLRLRIWHKLGAIALAFLLPLVVATVYLFDQRGSSITVANREMQATDFLRPLSSVTLDLFTYRSLSLQAAHGSVKERPIAAVEAAIDGDFMRLSQTDPGLQRTLSSTLVSEGKGQLEPSALASEWTLVKATGPVDALSFGSTRKLVDDVLSLYSYVGDASGLQRDPQLDTFYTGTAMLALEPPLTDQISQLGDALAGAAPAGGGSGASAIQGIGLLISQQLSRLNDALGRAFDGTPANNNDTALRPTLEPLLDQANTAVNILVGTANTRAPGGAAPGLTPADAQALTGRAVQSHARLWNAMFDQEQRMLHSRISKDETQNAVLLAVIGTGLALIIVLTTLISRRIARNLSRVADAAKNLAEGELDTRAEVTSQDEIGTLATTFNTMADHLQESYHAVEDKVRRRTRSLSLLQGVATAANKATTWDEVLAEALPLICDHMGWAGARAYMVEHLAQGRHIGAANELSLSPVRYTQLPWPAAAIESLMNRPASALVVRAHASGTPQGPEPLAATGRDEELRAATGLAGTIAFPVVIHQGAAGVVEFFTSEMRDPGEAAVALIAGLIAQLGRVREREIAGEALERAAEEAEAANRAKSAFLANMSHEIRTPMNAVMGMGELLLRTSLNEEQQSYARTIQDSAESLLTIINDILDFSKVEAGKFQLEQVPVDLLGCVEAAFDLIAPKAGKKAGLDLAYVMDDALPDRIVGDPVRLRQILINLLDNAVKFTDSGEIVLTVTRMSPDGGGDHEGGQGTGAIAGRQDPRGEALTLRFSVRDSGVGIPADRLPQLFRVFEQLDSSTTRRYGGTGLGLAISSRLVELMGGTIWAESEPGSGSTFHFTIPTTTPAAQPPQPAEARIALRGKRLLVVDDNHTNQMIITRQADAWGMHVRATGSPRQALAWIGEGDPFDAAILDMQMPEMDGYALAREIARLRQGLPMFLLTSTGNPESSRSETALFVACHTKPIKAERLYESLRQVLNPHEATQQPQETAEPEPAAEELKPLLILLAEDNNVNQKVALRMLNTIGYAADVVGNGEQVLEALRRKPYDLVLMDVHMPVMNGLDASRAIYREWPQEQRPYIIALTASAMPEDHDACLAAGMDDYLTKPLSLTTLAGTLNRFTLRTARSEPPSRPPSEQPPEQPMAMS
ncbi:hybrid sensor histidine kinase/response regulator [Streptacidiphilus rugosus]|uniref:hybrid sensor histidine kinase/response regulator n=1 Tax=Streptacidiphilus rugosus TaxID=405783 RepID=UPI00069079B1|nr:response regulator [Streptacidiphilus rugosus]